MTSFTEFRSPLQFLLSEGDGNISRENGVVAAGQVLEAGTVIQLTPAFSLVTTGDLQAGDRTLSNLASSTGLLPGRTYEVAGTGIPAGATFVMGESGADEVIMDRASTADETGTAITITQDIGQIEAWVTGQTVLGILGYRCDSSSGQGGQDADVPAMYIARLATVNKNALIFPSGTDAEVASGLADLNIIVR
jgi:hypothetical protein